MTLLRNSCTGEKAGGKVRRDREAEAGSVQELLQIRWQEETGREAQRLTVQRKSCTGEKAGGKASRGREAEAGSVQELLQIRWQGGGGKWEASRESQRLTLQRKSAQVRRQGEKLGETERQKLVAFRSCCR